MSSSYTILPGDTYSKISCKKYGSENYSGVISGANPGVSEPFVVGTTIAIPTLPNTPQDKITDTNAEQNEIVVKIDKERFRYWSTLSITKTIDSIDTIQFSGPFDSRNTDYQKTFQPLTFKDITVEVGGEKFFMGVMVNPISSITPDSKQFSVNGYSLPGVLNDCTMPSSSYPLEFNNQRLDEIADKLCEPFGITTQFDEELTAAFTKVTCAPSKKVLSFLAILAKQRNLIMSSTPEGALIFRRAVYSGEPVVSLEQGTPPVISVTPDINPQEFYSHITGIKPSFLNIKGPKYTVANPLLKGIVRPFTFRVADTEEGDLKTAVESKMGRMYGNAVSYNIALNTWRTSEDRLFETNKILNLSAPDAMIYNAYDFVISSITFKADSDSRNSTINLKLPGSYSGQAPEGLPWD